MFRRLNRLRPAAESADQKAPATSTGRLGGAGSAVPDGEDRSPEVAAALVEVERCRRRDRGEPEQRADLMEALQDLGAALAKSGHPDPAIDADVEALEIGNELVPDLGGTEFTDPGVDLQVDFLVDTLAEAGRWDRWPAVLPAIESATRACRYGVDQGWPGYGTRAALALRGLSRVLAHAGRAEEALAASQAAVDEALDELGRIEAVDDPAGGYGWQPVSEAYDHGRWQLMWAIVEWAKRLEELDRHEEALGVVAEAVAGMRPTGDGAPDEVVAVLLGDYARRLEAAGRDADAAGARADAIGIYRELSEGALDWVDEDARLLDELRAQVALLTRLGRPQEAERLTEEAERYARELAPFITEREDPAG